MYAYNAALYCDDCANKIMVDLDKIDAELVGDDYPAACLMADSGDTDDYPQYASDNEESDCPEHCDGCGEFLGNSLTSDGCEYVASAYREDMLAGCTDSVAVTIWREYYSWVEFAEFGRCDKCGAEGVEIAENDDYDMVCEDCTEYDPSAYGNGSQLKLF